MTLATRSSTLRRFAVGSLAGMSLAGCQSAANVHIGIPTTVQAEIFRAASEDYNHGTERPPRDTTIARYRGKSMPDDEVPWMYIRTLTLKSGRAEPPRRLLGAIRSEGDYALLGIQRGTNLVWRKTADSTVWITPERSGAGNFPVVRDSTLDRRAMPNHEIGLLRIRVNSSAIVLCTDNCPSGHCIRF